MCRWKGKGMGEPFDIHSFIRDVFSNYVSDDIQKITDAFSLHESLILHIKDASCELPWGTNISETRVVDPSL